MYAIFPRDHYNEGILKYEISLNPYKRVYKE